MPDLRSTQPPRVLVTGGAGLIGSHIVDAALAEGWRVRILDNLERQTHRHGRPDWIPAGVEFLRGDVRNRRDWTTALDGIDIVFHEAAYGGYMPQIAKFMHVNSVGTALMLETIRDHALPVKKVLVASSQAVYDEGAYTCPEHGRFYGKPRAGERMAQRDYAMHCPICDAEATPAPTDEAAPTGGANVYAISKTDQERLVLTWGQSTGIPAVALRYSCTYGPRQSVFNPYTGVIAIFCTRLMNDLPPVVYEDGRQSRDLVFVEDVARANIIAAKDSRADGQVINVGSGQAAEIGALARLLADRLGKPIEPRIPGEYRPGEMRALISETQRMQALGWRAETDLTTGIDRYLRWIGGREQIKEYFTAAERALKRRSVVKQSRGSA